MVVSGGCRCLYFGRKLMVVGWWRLRMTTMHGEELLPGWLLQAASALHKSNPNPADVARLSTSGGTRPLRASAVRVNSLPSVSLF